MAIHQSLSAFGLEDRSYSLEEWQAIELRTGEKFEYHEGRLVPWRMMAGGSFAHSEISGNLIYTLGSAVRERAAANKAQPHCGVHTSDLGVLISGTLRYVYPDAAVVCGKPAFDKTISTAVTNPTLVAEVLSPSSVAYDTGEKFDYYASLKSLKTYVLVTQDYPLVEVRSRSEAGGPWTIVFAKAVTEQIELASLGVDLHLAEVYRGIEFEEAA